jgi:hypothetical protein
VTRRAERDHHRRVAAPLDLPSAGPEPIAGEVAAAAVRGYQQGRRPLWFRPPGTRTGRWVDVPAFGWARFDTVAGGSDDTDLLAAEALHGRLDPAGHAAVTAELARLRPTVEAAVARSAGRAFPDLPADELSVLGEPGTVGAALREVQRSPHFPHVTAALHHRYPALVPHVDRVTRLQLLPHVEEGDSDLHAVVHRELQANAEAFAELSAATGATPLRLHDVLVWLAGSLRLTHAVALGGGPGHS